MSVYHISLVEAERAKRNGEKKEERKKRKRDRERERGGSKNLLARRFPYEYGNRPVTDETHSKRDKDASFAAHVPRCTRASPRNQAFPFRHVRRYA